MLIDANLLFVLVAYSTGKLGKPGIKGCGEYEAIDAKEIEAYVRRFQIIGVTPHVLTEVSNLIGRCRSDLRRLLRSKLRELVSEPMVERQCVATDAMQDKAYERLGLTDAALARLASSDRVVFTNDRDLHAELASRGVNSVHYDHMLRPHSRRRY